MMNWERLRVFHAAAECLSMARAGDWLEVSASAVSRQIAALERSLGCRLFHRHARGLALTEQGRLLHAAVARVMRELREAEEAVGGASARVEGLLRVSCGESLGGDWLAPRLGRLLDAHPGIRVSLGPAVDEPYDVAAGESDVAILYARPTQESVVHRRLMDFEIGAYASPGYIARWGAPEGPDDLDRHRLLGCRCANERALRGRDWILRAGRPAHEPRRPAIETHSTFAARRAASLGAGIAAVPDFMARGRTDLVRVLEDIPRPSLEAWIAYPEAMRGNRRVAAFVEFAAAEAGRGEGP